MNQFESNHLLEHFKEQVEIFNLKECRVIVGVSGGVDSMVLLHLCVRLKLKTFVVHINYKKRDQYSDLDEQLVRNYCKKNKIEHKVFTYNENDTGNFQNNARKFRFNTFKEVSNYLKEPAKIILAHHQDDQVETVLYRFLKGYSWKSWSAIKSDNEAFLRPLLSIKKKEIIAYACNNEVPWREDSSNQQNDFSRNYIRNELIPAIINKFPQAEKKILKLSEYSNKYTYLLRAQLDKILIENSIIDLVKFTHINPIIQEDLLLQWITDNIRDISITESKIKDLITKLNSPIQSGFTEIISDDYLLNLFKNELIILNITYYKNTYTIKMVTNCEKHVSLERFNIAYSLQQLKSDFKSQLNKLFLNDSIRPCDLTIRNIIEGEKVQPMGMKQGRKLINDLLAEYNIPSAIRPYTIALEYENNVVALLFPHSKFYKPSRLGIVLEAGKVKIDTNIALTLEEIHNHA